MTTTRCVRCLTIGLVLLAVMAAGACGAKKTASSAGDSNQQAPPRPTARRTTPAGVLKVGRATWSGECARVVKRLQAELAKLPSPCKADADCTCYGGGVEGVSGCGGASDKAAAARIYTLTRAFNKARCDYGVDCRPKACRVACEKGRCLSRF